VTVLLEFLCIILVWHTKWDELGLSDSTEYVLPILLPEEGSIQFLKCCDFGILNPTAVYWLLLSALSSGCLETALPSSDVSTVCLWTLSADSHVLASALPVVGFIYKLCLAITAFLAAFESFNNWSWNEDVTTACSLWCKFGVTTSHAGGARDH
jgi:hypothetical protein